MLSWPKSWPKPIFARALIAPIDREPHRFHVLGTLVSNPSSAPQSDESHLLKTAAFNAASRDCFSCGTVFFMLANHQGILDGIADHPHILNPHARAADIPDDQSEGASKDC